MSPVDMNAQRKDLRQGIEAEMSEKPIKTSCHATVGAAPMLAFEPLRNLRYVAMVAIEKAATIRRNEKTKMTTRFFDALIWYFEMNHIGKARMMTSVTTSSAVITAHLAVCSIHKPAESREDILYTYICIANRVYFRNERLLRRTAG